MGGELCGNMVPGETSRHGQAGALTLPSRRCAKRIFRDVAQISMNIV